MRAHRELRALEMVWALALLRVPQMRSETRPTSPRIN